MKSHGSCPKCGSLRIVREAFVPDRTEGPGGIPLSIRIEENPTARMFRLPRYFPLRAWVCGDCGYTELYVDRPADVVAAEARARQGGASLTPGSTARPGDAPQRVFIIVVVALAVLLAVGMAALVLLAVRISP